MGSGLSLEYCDRSDIGRRRSNNQDSKAVLEPWSREQYRRRGWLFIVADGMGAHAAGEMASAIAVEQVALAYEKLAPCSPPLALCRSIEQANAEIHARGESAVDLKGMGTTCTALALLPRGALVGHVGDSRAYRVRDGRIEQLSRDHSLAWEFEEQRGISGDPDIPAAPRNIITRSMGPHDHVAVDLEGPFPVAERDVFVLCSDGLSGQVEDAEIGLLAAALSPRDAAAALVGLCLSAGPRTTSPSSPPVQDSTRRRSPTPRRKRGRSPIRRRRRRHEPDRRSGCWQPPRRGCSACSWRRDSCDRCSAMVYSTRRDAVPLIMLVVGGLLLFGAVGAILLAGSGQRVDVLPPGRLLGKGPYRSHACAATEPLVEGVVASVEAAADGLSPQARTHALEHVAAARRHMAGGDFRGAVAAAAEAIAVYTRSIEEARG